MLGTLSLPPPFSNLLVSVSKSERKEEEENLLISTLMANMSKCSFVTTKDSFLIKTNFGL
jgi:hypothetical protein